MHTATYLDRTVITAQLGAEAVSLDHVFPNWSADDRFGIVVDRPFGLIGASLLIQTAALLFYEVQPERRSRLKRYPELYAFLLDEPTGDLGMLDFYPARKEVVVPRDQNAVIDAINDRAITRLAVVDGPPGDHVFSWDDRNTAIDRIVTAYAYSPIGTAAGADLVMKGTAETEHNVSLTLQPELLIDMIMNWSEEDIAEYEPQLLHADVGFDAEDYSAYARVRASEVPQATRDRLVHERTKVLQDGRPIERYRQIPVEHALERLVPTLAAR